LACEKQFTQLVSSSHWTSTLNTPAYGWGVFLCADDMRDKVIVTAGLACAHAVLSPGQWFNLFGKAAYVAGIKSFGSMRALFHLVHHVFQ